MPVTLGAKPEHGFDQPLGLLSDCHRRIEDFLGMMIRVLERSQGATKALTSEERDALIAALRYFEVAAPRHTQDEELSLFPRLRESENPEAHTALARLDALEDDHRHADALHEQVARVCREWLDTEVLPCADAEHLGRLLRDLHDAYARHISVEDNELFPLCARVLDAAQLAKIGAEMAQRRGLQTNGLEG